MITGVCKTMMRQMTRTVMMVNRLSALRIFGGSEKDAAPDASTEDDDLLEIVDDLIVRRGNVDEFEDDVVDEAVE